MLSRFAIRNAQHCKLAIAIRAAASGPPLAQDGPERDLVNFPRRPRPEFPAPVRHGFIPEGFFTMFYKKTGVTGPYAFLVGLATFLGSKEIFVMEHEGYCGLTIILLSVVVSKKIGPAFAAIADKEVDKVEHQWKESRMKTVRAYEEAIEAEKKEQWRAEGQTLLLAAKKENVAMQLEADYRERLATVYREITRRLDYQVEKQHIERRLSHKHMVQWIVSNVRKSITPDQEKECLNQCITDLRALAVKA